MLKTMPLAELHYLYDTGELPNNIAFKIVGGRTVYNHIGWMWRKSDKQIYLNKYALFDSNEYVNRRYLANETMIQIIKKD